MISRAILSLLVVGSTALAATSAPLKVLFLGDRNAHQPRQRFDQLQPVFAKKQIELTYTEKPDDLLKLDGYDGLMVFANIDTITPAQEKALLAYVESGKGFIPVHCASYCFRNSDAVVKMIGAQFRSHTTGVFRTKSTGVEHPILKDFEPFQSWDETYVHTKHNNEGRTVLEIREDRDLKEPWTWVRTQGKGRVFYTAWGHDHRTWSHPGFHNLLERGTRWACGQDPSIAGPYVDRPKMTDFAADAKPFEYVPAKLPFYPPGERWGTLREPISKMQKPLTPEESIKHYSTPVDFEIKTFVAEDQLGGGKPICMTWDERGRLWLALSYDYPNELKSEGEGRDKIVCCEDVNGDGTCDKITVFADKLSIPTSILPIRGGLVVHMAPNTWFMKDSDGDGKADVKQILFTGWGTNDTHAGPSSLRYGPDNWIYGMCGYSGFNGQVNGEYIRFGQGLYRFRINPKQDGSLTVSKLEFLRSTNNNSWGVAFNEQGELFGSTANGCPLVHCAIPNRYYEKVKGLTPGPLQNIAYDNHIEPVVKEYRQVDWHGGFTAGAGLAIYTARTYPEEYWNKVAFVSEPTAHLTAAMVLQPNGASYTARYGWNLLAGRDDWAAPIDAQVGPDGHMWVIDWYNIIVQHNPTPAGYRTGRGNAYEIDLRDKKYGRVYRVVYKKAKPEPRIDLANATPEKLQETLKHHNMTWRLHAQRILAESGQDVETRKISGGMNSAEMLRNLLKVADAQPNAEFGPMLASLMMDQRILSDPNLNHALTIASVVHAGPTLAAIAKSNVPPEGMRVVELVARNAGGSDLSDLMIGLAEAKSPAVAEAIIRGLAVATKPSKPLTADAEKAVGRMLTSLPAASRGRLLKLSSSWGVKGLDSQLAELSKGLYTTVADESASESSRLDAVRQIVEFQPESDDAALKIVAAVNGKSSPQFAAGVFEALSASRAKGIGSAVVAKIRELPATARPIAMRVVLARPESAKAFLDSVEKGDLRFDVLELDQKAALSTHPDATVRERAKKLLAMGGGLPDADRQKVIHQFEPILKKTGDVGLGKKMFVQHCAKCHKHGGEGLTIGPDLTGFAVHPKEEILIHVLDPSRSVEGNYKAYTARLADGRVVTGLLASETRTSVELVDAENKRHALNRDDLDELKESTKSLMPEGFEKQMTADDLTNLLEFMAQKGKYVPIPLDKYATSVSTRGMFNETGADAERLVFREWKPVEFKGVPFYLVDPQGDKVKNAIVLNSPQGRLTQSMPKSVTLPCNTAAKAIHVLGGIGGWASPYGDRGTVSVVVTLNYDDGQTEKVEWKNGVHIADYIRRVDVPQSEFAFRLRSQQVRYLSVEPKRNAPIKSVTFEKGPDTTAPVFMAVTIETP
jgi:putative membrane-bound dehydrogenase-like protein